MEERRRDINEDSFLLISPLYSRGEDPIRRYERGFLEWKYGDSDREFDHGDREEFVIYLATVADRAQEMSLYDPLTGAVNRRALYGLFEHRRASIRRSGEPEGQGIAAVDVTMKIINDDPRFGGHQGGDKYLNLVAEALRESAKRQTDVVARTGGDEFLVFLPGTDLEGTRTVADRITSRLVGISDEHFEGVSSGGVGAYHFVQAGDTQLEEVSGEADKALYDARKEGKARKEAEGLGREPPTSITRSDSDG